MTMTSSTQPDIDISVVMACHTDQALRLLGTDVPQGGQAAGEAVGHVPGLAPDPVRREAGAEHGKAPGGPERRPQPDHAAHSCRRP